MKGVSSMDSKFTILIIDDDRAAGWKSRSILLDCGFRVFLASTAQNAAEMMQRHKVDLAIIEAGFKEIEGYKLAAVLRGLNKSLKIIMTAERSDSETERQCRQAGILHYALKPLNYQQILSVIERSGNVDKISLHE